MRRTTATLFAAALCLLLSRPSAEARNVARNTALLNGGSIPTWSVDFRTGTYASLSEVRANNVWDYGPTGAIVAFGTNVAPYPVYSQSSPTQARGLGVWLGRSNIFRGVATQVRAVTNGSTYNFWCDSVGGTGTFTLTDALSSVVTCNGWAGFFQGVAGSTSLTATASGTITQANLVALSATVGFSPPIVTTSATVTVNPDHITIPTSVIPGFVPNKGTMIVDFIPISTLKVNPVLLQISDGTASQQVRIRLLTGAATLEVLQSAGSTTTTTDSVSVRINLPNRLAVTWGPGILCAAVNGGASICVYPAAPISTLTTNYLGAGSTFGGILEGYLQAHSYIPKTLRFQVTRLSQ